MVIELFCCIFEEVEPRLIWSDDVVVVAGGVGFGRRNCKMKTRTICLPIEENTILFIVKLGRLKEIGLWWCRRRRSSVW